MIHHRSWRAILGAPLQQRHWNALGNIVRGADDPFEFVVRYLSHLGEYPAEIRVKTSSGPLDVQVYSGEDIQTINEIFFRDDYPMQGDEKIVVDFGSNIGISTLWWTNRSADAFCYLFEPVPMNIERLQRQLDGMEDRYRLSPVAVGTEEGRVSFGWEPSGRYGGIGRATGTTIEVPCVDSNAVLAEIVARHGRIDILKIDIETMEKIVTERIPEDLRRSIDRIYVEYGFRENAIASTHDMAGDGFITRFTRRA